MIRWLIFTSPRKCCQLLLCDFFIYGTYAWLKIPIFLGTVTILTSPLCSRRRTSSFRLRTHCRFGEMSPNMFFSIQRTIFKVSKPWVCFSQVFKERSMQIPFSQFQADRSSASKCSWKRLSSFSRNSRTRRWDTCSWTATSELSGQGTWIFSRTFFRKTTENSGQFSFLTHEKNDLEKKASLFHTYPNGRVT